MCVCVCERKCGVCECVSADPLPNLLVISPCANSCHLICVLCVSVLVCVCVCVCACGCDLSGVHVCVYTRVAAIEFASHFVLCRVQMWCCVLCTRRSSVARQRLPW